MLRDPPSSPLGPISVGAVIPDTSEVRISLTFRRIERDVVVAR